MKKVLLLLAEGFEIYEASVFIDVIGWNLVDGDGTTVLYSCGFDKVLKTSFNQRIIVDFVIDEIDVNDFDALAIPGGFEEYDFYHEAYSEKFLNVIREFNARNKIIASICVGSLPIGKSGVLNNRNATTYNIKEVRQNMLRSYGANVINQPIVIDDNIITSYGPGTATDVAFILLEKLTSKENAEHIKYIMGFIAK